MPTLLAPPPPTLTTRALHAPLLTLALPPLVLPPPSLPTSLPSTLAMQAPPPQG